MKGFLFDQNLPSHIRFTPRLPPVLRAYVGCATALFGDVAQADVVKIHKASGKVTFLAYDDFDGKPLPQLRWRAKVNLRTRWVQVFDHSAEAQALASKERFPGNCVRKVCHNEATRFITLLPDKTSLDSGFAAEHR